MTPAIHDTIRQQVHANPVVLYMKGTRSMPACGFSARVVEAEEAYRIGLLNHLVPCAQLREKTMELATMIANNRRDAVMGVKALLLKHMGHNLEEQWATERDYTTNVVRGAKAEEAFPDFIARKGRPLPSGNA